MFRNSTSLPAWVLLAALSSACSEDETPLGPGHGSPASSPAVVLDAQPTPVNGRIVYSALVDGDLEIVSVNPDGTGLPAPDEKRRAGCRRRGLAGRTQDRLRQ